MGTQTPPSRKAAVTARSGSERNAIERDPARVVAFSDAVIAIAITLLVLEIHPPEDTRHLLHGLGELWPSYVSYVITFMLIGQIWANHHVMFDHIRHADRLVLFLNTLLLMDIAFLPFAAGVLADAFRDGQGERTAVVLHGITFEVAAALFNVIWWHAKRHHRLLAHTLDAAGVRAIGRRFLLALAWIGTGTLLGALLPVLGVAVIAAFIVFYWLPISGELGSTTPKPTPRSEPDSAGQSPHQDRPRSDQ
ncbi:TMEM175 family protein [Spirillospora sp. CA-142024]|uniref:TMEM175 family protein n=1 Tax=Spirillospora sp. CA-142024 TaxID=3240036 RepID=UPI003D915198